MKELIISIKAKVGRRLLKLCSICLLVSSCAHREYVGIELDWYGGWENKIVPRKGKAIDTNDPRFLKFGCLHIDEAKRLAQVLYLCENKF